VGGRILRLATIIPISASIGGFTACAGCPALSDPQQSLVIAVNDYGDVPRRGFGCIERDSTELVHQYVEVGAVEGDGWTTVETRVGLGELPNGTRIGVTASFGDGLEADGSITLDCASTSRYVDDVVYVQLDTELDLYLNEACHDESPSDETRQGGVSRSWLGAVHVSRPHRLSVLQTKRCVAGC